MRTLHIAPGYSAGRSLIEALGHVRPQDEVLGWPDDLSCGPLEPDESAARAAWWGCDKENWDLDSLLTEFWGRVFGWPGKLIVWFARHSAAELAFFLNSADCLKDRPYEIIDATGRRFPTTRQDGSLAITQPTMAVSLLEPSALASLLGTERELTAAERELACKQWSQLKTENASFRIVTETGLISAPTEYFDRFLLEEATGDWQRMSRLIGSTMAKNDERYFQVGDRMLQRRVIHLVEIGAMIAEGDPWVMRDCRVRLP